MSRAPCLYVLLLLCFPTVQMLGQNTGKAPSSLSVVTDIYTAFRLPALMDSRDGVLGPVVFGTQVGSRALTLALNGGSALDGWSSAVNALQASGESPSAATQSVTNFAGATASALNGVIASGATYISLTAPSLNVDQPIQLRSGVILNLDRTVL